MVALFAVALFLGAGAYWALRPPPADVVFEPKGGGQPTAPAPAPTVFASAVTLEIASAPPGAQVTRLDTNEGLGVTPLKLELGRLDKTIALRLELAGHQVVQRQVNLSSSVSLSVDLPELKAVEPVKTQAPKSKGSKKVTRDGQVGPLSK